MKRTALFLVLLSTVLSCELIAKEPVKTNPKLLKITVAPYLGAHAFPSGSGVGSSPEIGSIFTTPLTETTHFLFGIGFSQGFKDQSLRSITTTEWGLQFDTPFELISPYAQSYTTLLFVRDTNTRVSQLAIGFGLRFFMKKEGNMVLRTDARFGAGSTYRTGFERLAITPRPKWFKPMGTSVLPFQKSTVTATDTSSSGAYRVIAASMKNQDDANRLSSELTNKGFKTYLWRDKANNLYHVQVYFADDIQQATFYKEKMIKAGYKDTYLMKKV